MRSFTVLLTFIFSSSLAFAQSEAPLPNGDTDHILSVGGCKHGGQLLTLSWSLEAETDRTELRLRIAPDRLPAATARFRGDKGKVEYGIVLPGEDRLQIDLDFLDRAAHRQGRGRLTVSFPGPAAGAVQISTADGALVGKAKFALEPCADGRRDRYADEELGRDITASTREEARAFAESRALTLGLTGRSSAVGVGILPDGLGLASNEPPFDLDAMSTCVEREMFDREIIGYSYSIAVDRWVFPDGRDAVGWRRAPWEEEAPSREVTPGTRMTIASVSKPITAMAVMRLVEDGDLSLDDAFYPLIDDRFPGAPNAVNAISIRQLLQHRSGMPQPSPDVCSSVGAALTAGPDGTNQYSNLHYCLLREVIEAVSGDDYVSFVQDEVLAPAGITAMSCDRESDTPTLYYRTAVTGEAGWNWDDFTASCGAYGWYASSTDLARLLAHYRNNTFLTGATAATMETDCNNGFCLGWQTYGTEFGTAYGHNGLWRRNPPDNRGVRTGMVHLPRGIDATLILNQNPTTAISPVSVLIDAYEDAFLNGCRPPPPGPPVCPPTGCGTQVNGRCADVGILPDGNTTPAGFRPFIRQNHPDGDGAPAQYCEDYPELLNHDPEALDQELVCASASLGTGGPYAVCKACGAEGRFWPGCECNAANPNSCGAGLTCLPSTGYGGSEGFGGLGSAQSFGTGRCFSSDAGVPDWECQADCNAIYGDAGYCYHGSLPLEAAAGSAVPICASNLCALGGRLCAEEGAFCNADTGQCEVECNGAQHNPDQDLFSCAGRGYGPEYACNTDAQRCFIAGVIHP